jgi:DNA-binding LacI/PurR family transcriptional regulator
MASRKDVADRAGVSPASVSYYINQNGYVSKEAGEKIQKAIDELNYTPNEIARSLRIKDSKQFVFFCNDIRNPFYSQLVHVATKVATKKDYTVLFSPVVDDTKYIKKLVSHQVSGVFASNNHMNEDLINDISKRNIPVVLLRDIEWTGLDSKISQIKVIFSSIMNQIVLHLKEQGVRSICYISSSRSSNDGEIDSKTKAFMEATTDVPNFIVYGVSSTEDAYKKVIEKSKTIEIPDAIVCTNDGVALGVLKAAEDLGLRVPEDLKIVGFDNSGISKYTNPSITTVDIDSEEIGEIVVDLLLKKTRGEATKDIKIIPKLIVRGSTTK